MFKPTEENIHCLETALNNNITKINALAGTGKTSTLKYISDNIPDKRVIYLAFNKKMADEAKLKFPDNTECRTVHSLAYQSVGFKYVDKLKRPVGKYKNVVGTPSEISKHFKLSNIYDQHGEVIISSVFIGLLIQKTVNIFEYSSDKKLGCYHLPYYELSELLKKYPQVFNEKSLTTNIGHDLNKIKVEDYARIEKIIIDTARKLWKLRIDLDNDILCTHDTYLKLFQLSKPNLSTYDYIFLDEAQDSNECILDIVLQNRECCNIVMVGDHNQAIYGWRGSINLLEKLPNVKECKLTTSYRFGNLTAEIAGCLIGSDELKGVGAKTELNINKNEPCCIIFRGNTSLILRAVELIDLGKSVEINTDIKDFIKLMNSAIELNNDNLAGVKHDKLIPFISWEDLCVEAENDIELARIVKLVEKCNIKRVLAILNNYKSPVNPDFVLTTAHKSKGLEWTQVELADDFKSILGDDISRQEKNLLYVAVTRARKSLKINNVVNEYLSYFWEKYTNVFGEKVEK